MCRLKSNWVFQNHFQTPAASRLTECDGRRQIFTFLFPCQNLNLPITAGFSAEERKERKPGPLHLHHSRHRLNWDKTHQRESVCKIMAVYFFSFFSEPGNDVWLQMCCNGLSEGFIVWVLAINDIAEYVKSHFSKVLHLCRIIVHLNPVKLLAQLFALLQEAIHCRRDRY